MVSGDIVGGHRKRDITNAFATLFEISTEQASGYLTGQSCIIKRGMDQNSANRTLAALAQIGDARLNKQHSVTNTAKFELIVD